MTVEQKNIAISKIRSTRFLKMYYLGSMHRVIKFEEADQGYLNYLANSFGYIKWILKQF